MDVLGGAWVVDHAGEHDVPQGRVCLAVAAAVEAVPLVLAAAGIERRRAAEVSESRLVAKPPRIVAGGDEERRSGVSPNAQSGNEFGRSLFDQGLEDGVDLGDLLFEGEG